MNMLFHRQTTVASGQSPDSNKLPATHIQHTHMHTCAPVHTQVSAAILVRTLPFYYHSDIKSGQTFSINKVLLH